jgi:hypothetical protein
VIVIVMVKRPPDALAFHPEKFLISLSDNVAENGSEKIGQISTRAQTDKSRKRDRSFTKKFAAALLIILGLNAGFSNGFPYRSGIATECR